MGAAIEDLLLPQISNGVICVKYNHIVPLKKIKLIEAGHPVPDENGLRGALSILRLVEGAGKNDLIICLISGGGSALLVMPSPPLTLVDKQKRMQQPQTQRNNSNCNNNTQHMAGAEVHRSDGAV